MARALRDAGFEVIYLGIRQRPEVIASVAVQEDVQVVGLSILSGAHVALTRKTADALRAAGAHDVKLVVGGTIPRRDVAQLEAAGAAAVYPTGTPLETLVESMRALVSSRLRWAAGYPPPGRSASSGPPGPPYVDSEA